MYVTPFFFRFFIDFFTSYFGNDADLYLFFGKIQSCFINRKITTKITIIHTDYRGGDDRRAHHQGGLVAEVCPHQHYWLTEPCNQHCNAGDEKTHSNFIRGVSYRLHRKGHQVVKIEESHNVYTQYHTDDKDPSRPKKLQVVFGSIGHTS